MTLYQTKPLRLSQNSSHRLRTLLTHRISLPNHLDIRVLEARFETDPNAPLIKRAAKEML